MEELWRCQRVPNRQVVIERVEKFIGTSYWKDVNLRGKLYGEKAPVASIGVRSIPDGARPSFAEATGPQSAFLPTQLGASFGPSWSTHWFRVEFLVPSEWAGSEVHLLWDSSCEAMLWSPDGNPLQGLTGGSCDEVLFIEVACNGMFGCGFNGDIFPPQPDKRFSLAQAELAVFNREAWDLVWDFDVLLGVCRHLVGGADHPRAQQALFVANEMVNLCDPQDPATWPRARALAAEFLRHKNGSGQVTVSCIGNTHIDTAWLWPYAETRRKCARSFSSQLRLMREFPSYRFACPQAQQLAWVREDYPGLFAEIQAAARGGQFCPTGGCWVEMDCNIPSGESIVRQFFYGQRFFEQHFGARCEVFWLPDTFGYNSQLPQLMKGCGMRFFLTQKLSWNLFNKLPSNTFVWQGLDGSEVLVHFPPADSYVCRVTVDEVVRSATSNRDRDRSPNSYMLFGFGDGGGGPTAEMLERATRLADLDGVPKLEQRSPQQFFEKLEAEICHPLKWVGELYFELHRGTFTTQAAVKKNNRRCEILLRDLEYFCTLAHLTAGAPYPFEQIERMWKLALLQQFHDVLPGTSIHLVYQDVAQHYLQIFSEADSLFQKVFEVLIPSSSSSSSSSVVDLTFCNTLSLHRTELVDIQGQPVIVSVPPFGFVKPSESPQTPPSRGVQIDNQTADGITVSNTFFAATFGASGVLRSLMVRAQSDQQDDWEAIDLSKGVPGNTFRMFDDVPLFWDAWCAEMYHLEKPVGLPTSPTSYEVVGQSPLRVTVRFHTKLSGASSVVQTVSVSAVSPLIEFDTSVDWHENRKFLKVFFPLSVRSESARYHVPYGWISRPTHRNTSWDMAKFEVVGHYWADLSQYDRGVALINDCKYGYAVLESLMSLSLLRSSKYPDEHADMGQHSFRYALFPHHSADLAPVINQAQAFNVPLRRFESAPLAALTSPSSPWLVSHRKDARTPSSAVILDAIKLSEVDLTSTILRFYESLGGSTSVFLHSTFKVLAAAQCNLLEDPLHPLTVSSHGLVVGPIRFNPFEVVTVKLTL